MKASSILGGAVLAGLMAATGARAEGALTVNLWSDPDAVHQRLEFIKDEGLQVSEKHRDRAEAKLASTTSKVMNAARRAGDAKFAERMAAEFGVSPRALLDQKDSLCASWAEITIAYTLDANARCAVTVDELIRLEQQGMGWGQIAAGLGFGLNETVNAARAEKRVAEGKARPDGRIAAIRIADQVAAEGPDLSSIPTP